MKKRLFGRASRPRRRGGRPRERRCRGLDPELRLRRARLARRRPATAACRWCSAFPRLEDYVHHSRSHGAIVGRVANRTAGRASRSTARPSSSRRTRGAHHLHGGAIGLGSRIWDMEADSARRDGAPASTASPDGEEGYPGDGRFRRDLPARGAAADLRDGRPARPADADQPRQPQLLQPRRRRDGAGPRALGRRPRLHPARRRADPDRRDPPVEGTRLDFSAEREIGDAGIDHNLVLTPGRDRKRAGGAGECPRTGRQLELWTDEPGLQVFDAAEMTIEGRATTARATGPCRPLPRGAALPGQHAPPGLAEHHPHAGEPVFPAAGGGDRAWIGAGILPRHRSLRDIGC